ncbi:MAG: ribosome biogenesis GTP-binding protein YsxC [Deltaproteobacteria bacterium]|nr:ribosome biogenesis GTP-binding protein YsxC [Deltaproteobacteria bacterium]
MQCSYITSAQRAHQLPDLGAPEIAMVGRSNCGKSSLLNALTGRRNLARASSTPGRTQMVNFFAIDRADGRIILADLPGYGFSASGREARRHWQELITAYLKRPALKQVLFLLDIRRSDPPGDEDLELLSSLVAGRAAVLPVLTKADKLSGAAAKVQMRKFIGHLEAVGLMVPTVAVTSVLKQTGIADLRRDIGLVE